jgi:competence ComEA-like helix-hairpin-helix protein
MRNLKTRSKKSALKIHQHSIWFDFKRNLDDYFSFNLIERKAASALAIICFLLITIPQIMTLQKKSEITDFTKVLNAAKTLIPSQQAEIVQVQAKQFEFNPNTATYEDFVALGLSDKLSNTILNYRDKGGKFYDEDDFKKMYGLKEADFERLAPYLVIEKSDYSPNKVWEKRDLTKKDNIREVADSFQFDPNTVTEPDLIRLGLSEKQAASWVKFRNSGVGFKTVADVKKLYCLTEKNIAHLEPLINISPTATKASFQPKEHPQNGNNPYPKVYSETNKGYSTNKLSVGQTIDINKASAEEWQKIPQIGAFRAKSIVEYREKLGGFASISQVSEVYSLPDSSYQAMKPFLKYETPVYRKININTASVEELDKHHLIDRKQASLIIAYREQHGKFLNVKGLEAIVAFRDKNWLERITQYLTVE